jgi:hypothetical protein
MTDVKGPKDEREPVGRHANFLRVGHTAFEFVLDFGQLYQGGTTEQLHTRIITSPAYAAELLNLLGESVEQYEKSFGANLSALRIEGKVAGAAGRGVVGLVDDEDVCKGRYLRLALVRESGKAMM